MRNKNKVIMTTMILLLAIGFAAVSTTLILNGTINFGANLENFEIIFTKSIIDGVDVSDTTISEDGKTLTFETKELSKKDEESILNFTVKNSSTQYDANVVMECIAEGANASEYYEIENTIPEVIEAQASKDGTVTVRLKKVSVEEITETFTCTITATAIERETIAESAETCEYEYPTLISDENQNGEPDIGDMVGICNERFYVYKNDGDTTSMLAEYNLEVGVLRSVGSGNSAYPPEVETNKQSPLAVGLKDGYDTYATVAYNPCVSECGSTNQWAYSTPKDYTDKYREYIEGLGVENIAVAISQEELVELGCSIEEGTGTCLNAPEWVYSTSYWTLSEGTDDYYVVAVRADGTINNASAGSSATYGVRPAIKIATSLIGAVRSKPTVCEGNVCWQDRDCSETVNLGDYVTLGNEGFHVYAQNDESITMLAEYNLDVGGTYTGAGYVAYENPTGLQNSTMIGKNLNIPYNGVTAFSDTSAIYEGSLAEGYVNTYSEYIKNTLGIENEATLMTYEELENLGCFHSFSIYCNDAPKWIYTTSYWTKTIDGSDLKYLFVVQQDDWYDNQDSLYDNTESYSDRIYYGVRPVITISKDVFTMVDGEQ